MKNAAFEEGYKAFKDGHPVRYNPYSSTLTMIVFNYEWNKGWWNAWKENELFA